MKKVILTICTLLSIYFISHAQMYYTDDTMNIKKSPIKPLAITNVPIIVFTATMSSNYSFSLEKDGETLYYNETTLSNGESYIIDMTIHANGRYKIEICNLHNNMRYEYLYMKNDINEIM